MAVTTKTGTTGLGMTRPGTAAPGTAEPGIARSVVAGPVPARTAIGRPHVVVMGAGWAGCAAAVAAALAGARVTLVERTDMILGTGLVGGIMKNNGRLTAAEELRAMGARALLDAIEPCLLHRGVRFPGHEHASLYDVTRIESAVLEVLAAFEIDLHLMSTCTGLARDGNRVVSAKLGTGEIIGGDAFIDATGTAGPRANCRSYRSGCVMCILRCPSFGPRISPLRSLGIDETPRVPTAATSGSVKVLKSSLSRDIVQLLEGNGVVEIPLPKSVSVAVAPSEKSCRQYTSDDFYKKLIVLHTGEAKVMVPYMPLRTLRSIPGLSRARFLDPCSGGLGNSVRYNAITPHDLTLRVTGFQNLFCAGEKVGLVVGHTEAILTGTLAGHNAVRSALRIELVEIPPTLMCGDFLSFVSSRLLSTEGLYDKYTFSGSVYLEHAVESGMYTTDSQVIGDRVRDSGLSGIFAARLVDG
jgi:hypothetical protein